MDIVYVTLQKTAACEIRVFCAWTVSLYQHPVYLCDCMFTCVYMLHVWAHMLHIGDTALVKSRLGFLLFIMAMFAVCLCSQFDTTLRFSYKFLYSPTGFLSWFSSGLSLIWLFKELQRERESEYSKRETQTFNSIIFRQEAKTSWSNYPSCLPSLHVPSLKQYTST